MADNIFKRWTSKWVRELDASGASSPRLPGCSLRPRQAIWTGAN